MATTTNYGWDTPDDTDLVKDGAAAIRTLGSSVDTTTKNLNPQTTTGALAYRSATANVNTALPIGTTGQVLRVNSGGTAPEWATTADQTPLTTKGDLFTFSTVDARLGVGANNTILVADSNEATGLKWVAPAGPSFVGCDLRKTATQSISNSTATKISFDSENFDTDGFHDNSSNNTRITIPTGKGGKYLFVMTFMMQNGDTDGSRSTILYINGSEGANLARLPACLDNHSQSASVLLNLNATDYVEFGVFQNSGSSNNILFGAATQLDAFTRFSCEYLGA